MWKNSYFRKSSAGHSLHCEGHGILGKLRLPGVIPGMSQEGSSQLYAIKRTLPRTIYGKLLKPLCGWQKGA